MDKKWLDDLDRDDVICMAKLAEQAERYNDMCDCMVQVVQKDAKLSVEERNLLSVAYKNIIGAHRASLRITNSIANASNQTSATTDVKLALVEKFKSAVEVELKKTCNQILQLIDNVLLPTSEVDYESMVFYSKMSGDYYRYLAESSKGEERSAAKKSSEGAYIKATDAASNHLPPTHPIRLGLALNFSVFHYEILDKPEDACALAKAAFDAAIAELDNLQEDSFKDSTLIMQLLRDNLTLWTSDNNDPMNLEEMQDDN